jgi:hypothetical protein
MPTSNPFQIIAARRERIRFATSREKPVKLRHIHSGFATPSHSYVLIFGFTPESGRSVAH